MNPLGTHVGPRNAAVIALALCAVLVCLVPASLIGKDVFPQPATAYDLAKMQKERMGRGVYAVRATESEVLVGWRYKSTDPADVAFDVYAGREKLNETPIRDVTYFKAPWTGRRTRYTVVKTTRPIVREPSMSWVLPADAPIGYFDIELTPPPGSVLPDGSKVGHHPCDCTVGDLDGDGEYELVVIWWPDNAADNASWHVTAETVFLRTRLSLFTDTAGADEGFRSFAFGLRSPVSRKEDVCDLFRRHFFRHLPFFGCHAASEPRLISIEPKRRS